MPDTDDLGRLPRRSRWVVVLAVLCVVAIAAAAVGVAALVGGRGSTPGAGGGPENPWDPDLPPGQTPAAVPGAVPPVRQDVPFPEAERAARFQPRPLEAEGHPYCRAEDVSFSAEPSGSYAVTFVLAAARPDVACQVSYSPYLEFSRGGENVEVLYHARDPRPGDWPGNVLVTEDRAAVLRTRWSGWCAVSVPVDTAIMFFLDNSVARATPLPRATDCAGPAPSDDRMTVLTWEPDGWTGTPASSFRGLEARLVDTVRGPSGLPTWVVELTATRRDIELDPCPAWSVRVGADRESYAWNRLNCLGVEDVRRDGTPYLRRDRPVRFAFFVAYGDLDSALTWELMLPEGPLELPLSAGPAAPVGEPRVTDEERANLHLYVSNQSFDEPTVRLRITMDGVELVSQEFDVEGQHSWVSFPVAAAAGSHTLLVTSDTGARETILLTLPEQGDRWAVVDYWSDGGARVDWQLSDAPIGFG